MIVSHEHRYVFWQVPNTGCSAVGAELKAHYGGQSVLNKHSHPNALLPDLPDCGRGYFLFATIRNPLDVIVTNYFKTVREFERIAGEEPGETGKRGKRHRTRGLARARWAVETGAPFADYFLRFYTRTFFSSTTWMHPRLSALIRYDDLNGGLRDALGKIGLESVGDLPVRNATRTKDRPWHEYYSASAQRRAVELFTPFLDKWSFSIPDSWETGTSQAHRRAELERVDRVGTALVAGRRMLPRSSVVRAAVLAARAPSLFRRAVTRADSV